jgi:hypothetical protein
MTGVIACCLYDEIIAIQEAAKSEELSVKPKTMMRRS